MEASSIRDKAWLMCDWVCYFLARSSPSDALPCIANIISIFFYQDIYDWLLCQILETNETPVSIISCSSEASKKKKRKKNQLRQNHSVNIKGMQRWFYFWWWKIIHLTTEVEKSNKLSMCCDIFIKSVLLLTNKNVL